MEHILEKCNTFWENVTIFFSYIRCMGRQYVRWARKKAVTFSFMMLFEQVSRITKRNAEKTHSR